MGKNRDLIQILLIVILGMFIPFLGAIAISYDFDLWKIASTFGYFLLIFAVELLVVYLYFTVSNKIAAKKLEEMKNNHNK